MPALCFYSKDTEPDPQGCGVILFLDTLQQNLQVHSQVAHKPATWEPSRGSYGRIPHLCMVNLEVVLRRQRSDLRKQAGDLDSE